MKWNESDAKVKTSPYESSKRTIFIIHGFLDLYEEMGWMGVSKALCHVKWPNNKYTGNMCFKLVVKD